MKQPCVYIMASKRYGTLYAGATSDPPYRVSQHKDDLFGGFTSQYGVKMMVWYEMNKTMDEAIPREKQIEKWNRDWKIPLMDKDNPKWRDLSDEIG
jgi:putative endonuclease